MASTMNPFDLLVDNDTDDLTELVKVSVVHEKKVSPAAVAAVAPKPVAKLPSKPLPPSQAVREARSDVSRGGGRGGRGGRGRDHGERASTFNGYSGGYTKPSDERDSAKHVERRGGYGGPRGSFHGGRITFSMGSDANDPNQPPASTPPLPFLHHTDIDDAPLSNSEFLTAEEMIRRRHRRNLQLSRAYKDYYWTLMSQLRSNYRDYLWKFGSPDAIQVPSDTRCAHSKSCNRKPMPMTRFCYSHILSDPKQLLYKGCSYVTSKSGSTLQNVCAKPILRSKTPSFCNYHLLKAKKSVAMSLKQAGLSTNDSNRMAPLMHIISAEFTHEILRKRRTTKKSQGNANADKMEEGGAE